MNTPRDLELIRELQVKHLPEKDYYLLLHEAIERRDEDSRQRGVTFDIREPEGEVVAVLNIDATVTPPKIQIVFGGRTAVSSTVEVAELYEKSNT